jgi:hypothetical protein
MFAHNKSVIAARIGTDGQRPMFIINRQMNMMGKCIVMCMLCLRKDANVLLGGAAPVGLGPAVVSVAERH